MKILKKLANIFLIIFFASPFCMVYAQGSDTLHIAVPSARSRGRYYVAQRRAWEKFYIEERRENTSQKTHGAFIERTGLGEYIVYDDEDLPEEFTHVIRIIDSDHYIVGLHYPYGEITPILKISRESVGTPWHIKSCHILGRVCLPSPEVYIEKTLDGVAYAVKSAMTTPDIRKGEIYNCITPIIGSLDEFTDIISFLGAFLFK